MTLRPAACLATLLCLATPVLTPLGAQQRPDTVRLTPVVVTATRAPAGQVAPTAAATRIDGDDLRARGITLVADALREVPGLHVARGGSAGAVTSVFVRGGESDYLQVLVDGIAINEPGGAVDFANLSADDIDRIEVVRGPASVLYGSDAVAGVVQIFTRRGDGGPRLDAGARGGSRGTREADLALGGGGSSLHYAMNAAHAATDGILPFNNRHRRTTVGGSAGTSPAAATSLRLTARATEGRYHFPTSSGGDAVDSNQYSFERRLVTGIAARHRVGPRVSAHLGLAVSALDAGTDDDPDNAADTAGSFASRSARTSSRQNADVRLDVALPGAATMSAGVDLDWERERTGFRSEHGTFGPYRAPDRDDRRWNRGWYTQLLGDAMRIMSYSIGGRVDENEAFGTFVTWRAGGGIRLRPGTTLRGSVGTAFKAPIFYEITGAGFALPNEAIDPERSRSWDAGIEQAVIALDREVMLGATWFDQRFEDMIQYIPDPADPFGLGQYRNIAGARASGLELDGRVAATSRLTIRANATTLRTRVVEAQEDGELAFQVGERLIRRPAVTARAIGTYRLGRGSFALSVDHVGPRDDVDFASFTRVRLPAHTLVGAGLEVPVGAAGARGSGLTLRAHADNLLGSRYTAIAGFPSPGRTILIGARAAFGR